MTAQKNTIFLVNDNGGGAEAKFIKQKKNREREDDLDDCLPLAVARC